MIFKENFNMFLHISETLNANSGYTYTKSEVIENAIIYLSDYLYAREVGTFPLNLQNLCEILAQEPEGTELRNYGNRIVSDLLL